MSSSSLTRRASTYSCMKSCRHDCLGCVRLFRLKNLGRLLELEVMFSRRRHGCVPAVLHSQGSRHETQSLRFEQQIAHCAQQSYPNSSCDQCVWSGLGFVPSCSARCAVPTSTPAFGNCIYSTIRARLRYVRRRCASAWLRRCLHLAHKLRRDTPRYTVQLNLRKFLCTTSRTSVLPVGQTFRRE